jgi:hypothetical protein
LNNRGAIRARRENGRFRRSQGGWTPGDGRGASRPQDAAELLNLNVETIRAAAKAPVPELLAQAAGA